MYIMLYIFPNPHSYPHRWVTALFAARNIMQTLHLLSYTRSVNPLLGVRPDVGGKAVHLKGEPCEQTTAGPCPAFHALLHKHTGLKGNTIPSKYHICR